MSLVEKRAEELGLCEDFINGQAGSLGSRIVNGVVGGGSKSVLGPRPRMSSSFPILILHHLELSRVSSSPFPLRSPWLYILLLLSSWPIICRLFRSPLKCLSYPTLPSTCCGLQRTAWHYLGVIPLLMQSDYQLRAFNAEVTGSFPAAFSPCSHSCLPTLVPSFGDHGEGCGGWCVALSSQDTSSPRTWRFSTISPSVLRPSLVVLGRFPSQLGPWAYFSK